MRERFCARSKQSKADGKWCTMMPPTEDWCCYKPARLIKPGEPGYFGPIWLCAECYDEWMKGDCLR